MVITDAKTSLIIVSCMYLPHYGHACSDAIGLSSANKEFNLVNSQMIVKLSTAGMSIVLLALSFYVIIIFINYHVHQRR